MPGFWLIVFSLDGTVANAKKPEVPNKACFTQPWPSLLDVHESVNMMSRGTKKWDGEARMLEMPP